MNIQFLCKKEQKFITLEDCKDCEDRTTCDRLEFELNFEKNANNKM